MDRRLSLDTHAEAEHLQIAIWHRMTPQQKLELVAGASRAVRELALAGLRQRHPDASSRELTLRYACLTLEPELARAAYPEMATLDLR
jgi:hypothetical protein